MAGKELKLYDLKFKDMANVKARCTHMHAHTPRVVNVLLMVKRLYVSRFILRFEHEYLLTLRTDMFQQDSSMHHLSSLLEGQNRGRQKLRFPPDCLRKNKPQAPNRMRGPVKQF